jgi:hypothetical protein
MTSNEFVREQFTALRREILSRQIRLFWTAVIGLLGVPALTYFALGTHPLLSALLPFFVLVVMVMFLAEQNAMMRAGRYIREHLEDKIDFAPGWEKWLESNFEYRLVERHFFACFLVIFFLFYFLTLAAALDSIWVAALADASGIQSYILYGAVAAYGIATIWVGYVVVHYWKSSVSTTASPKK